jgi:LAO/AO transport system kinase
MPERLLEQFRQHDRRALARLLSMAAKGEKIETLLAALGPSSHPSLVVAVTGSAGVGKSSLIGRLLGIIRARGQSVAVLASDPQSPLSGGALLGDRFRMPARADDEGVFIRSLAAKPGHGAVAEHVDAMISLLQAFPFDIVLLETVGAGQGDTEVRDLADVVVLLIQPETGDDLQWEKAGLLEVADIVVIHKADLPQAEQTEAQVRSMLTLGGDSSRPVLRVSSKTGEAVEALWEAIASCPRRNQTSTESKGDLLQRAQQAIRDRFTGAQAQGDPQVQELLARWREGSLPEGEAVEALFRLMARR